MLLNPDTFNVFTCQHDHKSISKLSLLCYWILTLSMFSFTYNIRKTTLNCQCFVTQSLHFQCPLQCYPSKMLISYYTISELSFLSFRPSSKPPLISSTFTLKGSPKMLWSYHSISEPSCPSPFHHELSLVCYWIVTLPIWFHHLHYFPISSLVTGSLHFQCFHLSKFS